MKNGKNEQMAPLFKKFRKSGGQKEGSRHRQHAVTNDDTQHHKGINPASTVSKKGKMAWIA